MCILLKAIQSIVSVFKLKNKGGSSKHFFSLEKLKMNVRTLSLNALKGFYVTDVMAEREFLLYFICFVSHILELLLTLLWHVARFLPGTWLSTGDTGRAERRGRHDPSRPEPVASVAERSLEVLVKQSKGNILVQILAEEFNSRNTVFIEHLVFLKTSEISLIILTVLKVKAQCKDISLFFFCY